MFIEWFTGSSANTREKSLEIMSFKKATFMIDLIPIYRGAYIYR